MSAHTVKQGTIIPLINVVVAERFSINDRFEFRPATDTEIERWSADEFISELVPTRRLRAVRGVLDFHGNAREAAGGNELYLMLALLSFCLEEPAEVSLVEEYEVIQYPLAAAPHENRRLAYLPIAPRVSSFEQPFGPHLLDATAGSMLGAYFNSAYRDGYRSAEIRYALARWYLAKMRVYAEDQIVDLCIALEAIFMSRDESKLGAITHRLAVRLANYYGEDDASRLEHYDACKALYDFRADIVHGGIPDASGVGHLEFAQSVVQRFLVHFLGGDSTEELLSSLDDDQWVPDDRLPRRLLEQRRKGRRDNGQY